MQNSLTERQLMCSYLYNVNVLLKYYRTILVQPVLA